MMALAVLSTVAMLKALDGDGRGWWAVYAVSSAAAMLSHYTVVFVLGRPGPTGLRAFPSARRAVVLANVGAAVLFMPWITGFFADLNSSTTPILDALSPFDPYHARLSLEHWLLGYPYSVVPLTKIPTQLGLTIIAGGFAAAVVGHLVRPALAQRLRTAAADRGFILIVLLAISVPLGSALVSAVSTNLFSTRNFAASTPAVALVVAVLIARTHRLVWPACVALMIGGDSSGP